MTTPPPEQRQPPWWQRLRPSAPDRLPDHLIKGEQGEAAAARHLRDHGYKILTRRFRGKHGELDLVARDGAVLAFVEVKTRSSRQFGDAALAVDREKQEHLISCSREYLRLLKNPRIPVRFDIVEVYLADGSQPGEIRLIQNAFPMSDQVSD